MIIFWFWIAKTDGAKQASAIANHIYWVKAILIVARLIVSDWRLILVLKTLIIVSAAKLAEGEGAGSVNTGAIAKSGWWSADNEMMPLLTIVRKSTRRSDVRDVAVSPDLSSWGLLLTAGWMCLNGAATITSLYWETGCEGWLERVLIPVAFGANVATLYIIITLGMNRGFWEYNINRLYVVVSALWRLKLQHITCNYTISSKEAVVW